MGTEAEKVYAAFEEKVKRTVYLDNLSPQVTDAVIKTAFEPYVSVANIEFIPNYVEPFYNSKCALVEMENKKQASTIIDLLASPSHPFMMSGMPRPVRARAAEPEMFSERPIKPGRKIHLVWLDPKDPDFQVAQEIKRLTKKHCAEKSFLLKKQQDEEEKLSAHQTETLKTHYQKFEMMDSTLADGSSKRLARRYGMSLTDENGY